MKRTLLTGALLIALQPAYTQINAVTETGDEVILYRDGTWKYLRDDAAAGDYEIPVSDKAYVKDNKSTFLVRSQKLNIGVWIDPKRWSFSKGTEDVPYEYQLQLKGGDLYAMLIAEKVQIPIGVLKGIAVDNARSAAPDIRVTREEYRQVNGVQVLMMQMVGTIQGMRFVYYGYYYSNAGGTIQFLAYTSENLQEEYLEDMELLLSGLVEL